MLQRVLYLIKTYLLTVLIFIVAKMGFMFYHADVQSFAVTDVFEVIRHGLSLDLSMGLYILSVPFLCLAVSIWVPRERLFQYILRPFYIVISLALALIFVADTSLYEFWLFKLDATCLQYLETPTEAMASVSTGYILMRLLTIALLTALFTWAYWQIPLKLPKVRQRILGSIGALLFIPLIIIGIRGGLDESTTNIGQVYYSQNQFLNHSAVNPAFSFFASLDKSGSDIFLYKFMDQKTCDGIVNQLYNTLSIDCDTLLTTNTPNIIVILLEGCGGQFTEIGGRADITPNLNRMAKEGIYFANCHANSWRTDRGTLCTWSGYPSFPNTSVMKIPAKSRTLPNIARTLQQERSYSTHYLYGGDINFTNMRSYLVSGGFQNLTWKADYTADEQHSAKWGVRDDITFQTLTQLTKSMKQPFLIGYSTLSSHSPWDVPIHQFNDEVLNAFYYLDQCVGNFIQQLRHSDLWNNTLVVMLPDHGIVHAGLDESNPLLNHIPMLWVGGAVKQPRRIEQVCNQTDLPATLLGQLGIAHDEYTFSRDVLSSTYKHPFAIHTYDDGYTIIDSASFVNYDFISNRVITAYGKDSNNLMERAKAVLQYASKDLSER